MIVHAVVDRIEGELAVLEVEGKGMVEWPVAYLPGMVREGSGFSFDIVSVEEPVEPLKH